MTAPPWDVAAAARAALGAFAADDPAPPQALAVAAALLRSTPFGQWLDDDPPVTVRELIVACGQLAAAHPREGLALALTHLAEDCRDAGPAPCPDRIIAIYRHLASAVPQYGPDPALRKHIRAPGLADPDLRDISLLAAVAAPLARIDTTSERSAECFL